MLEYIKQRDDNLAKLGFLNYEFYLQSELWAFIKQRLNESLPGQCQACGSSYNLQFHHRSYALPVLVGNLEDSREPIVRLCKRCHELVHTDGKTWFELDVVDHRMEYIEYHHNEPEFNLSNLPTTPFTYSEFDDLPPPPPNEPF